MDYQLQQNVDQLELLLKEYPEARFYVTSTIQAMLHEILNSIHVAENMAH
ncbi:MAG: hypothetical protein AAFW89_06640 [Bacteroidota bacterium]